MLSENIPAKIHKPNEEVPFFIERKKRIYVTSKLQIDREAVSGTLDRMSWLVENPKTNVHKKASKIGFPENPKNKNPKVTPSAPKKLLKSSATYTIAPIFC